MSRIYQVSREDITFYGCKMSENLAHRMLLIYEYLRDLKDMEMIEYFAQDYFEEEGIVFLEPVRAGEKNKHGVPLLGPRTPETHYVAVVTDNPEMLDDLLLRRFNLKYGSAPVD